VTVIADHLPIDRARGEDGGESCAADRDVALLGSARCRSISSLAGSCPSGSDGG
jgi:hypothetical protein